MTTFADLVDFVTPSIHRDIPVANVQHALREATIDFLTRSQVATDGQYIALRCGQSDLLLEPKGCRRVVTIVGIYEQPHCRGAQMWDRSWHELPRGDDRYIGWTMDPDDLDRQTILMPSLNKERRIYVRYAWTLPRDSTCTIPDWLYERFADTIVDGAVAMLLHNPVDGDKVDRSARRQQAAMSYELAINRARNDKAAQEHGAYFKPDTRHFFGG